MNIPEVFQREREQQIASMNADGAFSALSQQWLQQSMQRRYVYNFDWLGRPIIQYPQDMVAVQELIWQVQPDLIIETGIAHGGSLILSASLLALLDMCRASQQGGVVDPSKPRRKVIGIDIDIRAHNRAAIEAHPLAAYIEMVQGSSVAPDTVETVCRLAQGYQRVMVLLDSMHTQAHVLQELDAYAPMVSLGSYCVVFDTFVQDMPPGFFADRPWDVDNNPKTAVRRWLPAHPEFAIDPLPPQKLMITVAPDGFLKRIS
ncbi:MAG: cephalosporin hydroxylase family protein [Rhodoferax sp.]